MSFFSRPDLDNLQFKQLTGSTLTLSGQTQIATICGFTITDGNGKNVILTASGASEVGQVLTYDGTGVIRLTSPSSGTSTGLYDGLSPTTCTVGGMPAGTVISGVCITDILQCILVPTVSPILTPNSITMSVSPTSTLYEVGCQVAFTGITTYSRGVVSPVYCSGTQYRTGTASCYVFTNINGCSYSGVSNCCSMPTASIVSGVRCVSGAVAYNAGLAPTRSDGSLMTGSTCPAGTISTCRAICGIYPYFWGTGSTTPVAGQSLINGAICKCVGTSASDVYVNATTTSFVGKYFWVAIPSLSTSKTKWQGSNSPSNCGTIPGDLFAAEACALVNSPSSCWTGVNYKFYMTNYPTSVNYCMTLKNS